MSISLKKEEVNWLIEALSDFYWNQGGKTWGKNMKRKTHLFMALGWNQRHQYIVTSEEKGKSIKRIFIPKGIEAGGWWQIMKSISELAEVPFVNPFKTN